jgi:hypothetical protein
LADSDCTNCHGSLTAHLKQGETTKIHPTIQRFAKDEHPEFRPVANATDPGRLKFNHQLHMAPGITQAGGKLWTLSDIPEADRDRYRPKLGDRSHDKEAVQLDCASCHQMDGGDLSRNRDKTDIRYSPNPPARSAGAYMLPITYENQCRACHPLTLEPRDAKDVKPVTVPHRLQPPEVREFLWGAYAQQIIGPAAATADRVTPRPLPGKARQQIEKNVNQAAEFLWLDKVDRLEKMLFHGKTTCGECHSYEGAAANTAPQRIVPTQVPEVWFKSAKFDHAAHRAVDCRQCHYKAYTSTRSSDILIPGIDNCLQCHSPARTVEGKAQGGVRFDCTECHRYHHGEQPLQGIGARARKPAVEFKDVQEFLSGQSAANGVK